MMKLMLGVAAVSLILSSAALLYFISHDPHEFALPDCVRPNFQDWTDVVLDGCLDPHYAIQFIGLYGLIVFLPLAALTGLLRTIAVRPLS